MTQPQERITIQKTTGTETTTTTETVLLYAAQDAQGRLFLTDDRAFLPPDADECREFALAPEQVTWAMLQVEVEELRGTPVTIRVGDYHYATPERDTVPHRKCGHHSAHGSADARRSADKERSENNAALATPGRREIVVGALQDQVYSYEDETGRQFHWSVTSALAFAQARNEVFTISLSEMGVTLPLVRAQYQGLDERHALTCDLSQPLLFVPIGEKVRLLDGWHRVAKALMIGVDVLPACFLTQEEADACLLLTTEPGKGIDWGQNDTAEESAARPRSTPSSTIPPNATHSKGR